MQQQTEEARNLLGHNCVLATREVTRRSRLPGEQSMAGQDPADTGKDSAAGRDL